MATPGKNRLQRWCTIMQSFSSFLAVNGIYLGPLLEELEHGNDILDEHLSS